MLACADEYDRSVGGCDGGYSTTAGSIAIGFSDDDGAVVGGFFERFGLCFGLLADGGIEDHDGLIGGNGLLNLHHLVEQICFLTVSTGCINNDDLETFFLELLHTFTGNDGRIGLGKGAKVRDFGFGSILFQLVESPSSESIGADKACSETAGLVMTGKFGACSSFPSALETNKHDNTGSSLFRLERLSMRVDECDELIKDGFLDDPLFISVRG